MSSTENNIHRGSHNGRPVDGDTGVTSTLELAGSGIDVVGVSRNFDDFQALDDVDLKVPTGSMTALLGPSGSGKSTLLRTIAGLEVPSSGKVLIGGEDQTGKPVRTRNVGFVFQHYAAFKHMTVFENIAFGPKVRKWPKPKVRERVLELLDLVQLTGLSERYPSQLSGGQRQRMALARALAVEPSVLLLDEPFGALDAKVRKDLRTWLRRLHEEVHVTTIFVTHDQEEAMDIAEQIVVMNHGRIEQTGSATDLYDRPENEFVMGFVGEVNRLGGRLVRPHDLEIHPSPATGTVEADIDRVVRLGFSGRVEMTTSGDDNEVWAQVTRSELETLNLAKGQRVYVRPRPDAVTKEDTGTLEGAFSEEIPSSPTPIPAQPGLPV
ncbi:MAG: sulfate ABC transporter ATP-binding protein [Actinomycetota bacterium]|nr:sulfate ABC transporter ATP-binding protein [Actinomycetota bacterium]